MCPRHVGPSSAPVSSQIRATNVSDLLCSPIGLSCTSPPSAARVALVARAGDGLVTNGSDARGRRLKGRKGSGLGRQGKVGGRRTRALGAFRSGPYGQTSAVRLPWGRGPRGGRSQPDWRPCARAGGSVPSPDSGWAIRVGPRPLSPSGLYPRWRFARTGAASRAWAPLPALVPRHVGNCGIGPRPSRRDRDERGAP
jgi:hypothetical protein